MRQVNTLTFTDVRSVRMRGFQAMTACDRAVSDLMHLHVHAALPLPILHVIKLFYLTQSLCDILNALDRAVFFYHTAHEPED